MARREQATRHSANAADAPPVTWGESTRAIISILLFVHLFVLFTCLAANLAPSALQQRLLRAFRPYTQLLNFDPDGTRYFLTHASIRDVDHRIEVLAARDEGPADEPWQNISRGLRGTERYHRYQRLADTLAFFQEDERTTAVLAESIARCYAAQSEDPISQLRCRRHTLQSWETLDLPDAQVDPNGPNYFGVVYLASVLTDRSGEIHILKRSDAKLEAAPTRGADGSDRANLDRSTGND